VKWLLLLLSSIVPNSPIEEPKFTYDDKVVWVDGSRGIIISNAYFVEDEYYYSVRFKSQLSWLLPESGLKLCAENKLNQ
jgi:hypothetical protein